MNEINWESLSNIRASAWSLTLNGEDLCLTAVQTRMSKLHYRGHRVLKQFETKTDEEIQDFIFEFQSDFRVRGGQAFLGIPRDELQIVVAEFPLEARNSLEETVSYQVPNFFPGNLDDFDFFHQVIGDTEQLKVMILAAKKEVMGRAFAYIRKWNLKLSGITLDTFGLINGLAKSDKVAFNDERIVVLNFRPSGLELIGLNQGRLTASEFFEHEEGWNRDALIRDLEEGFSLARLDPNEVDRFLITGDLPKDLREWLERDIGIQNISWQDSAGLEIEGLALPGFGVAVTSLSEKQILELNILPERLRRRKRQWPLLLVSLVLSILLITFVVKEAKAYRQLKTDLHELNQRNVGIQERLTEISDLRSQHNALHEEVQLFKNYRARNPFFKMMLQLSVRLPEHTYLSSFQIRDHTQVTLSGESEQAIQIERLLNSLPFLTDVKDAMAITRSRGDDSKQRFSYKATLVQEALQ